MAHEAGCRVPADSECGLCTCTPLDIKKVTDQGPFDVGMYLPGQHPGSIPNGTVVAKCNSNKGDGTSDGERGVVISSIGELEHEDHGTCIGYFVVWQRDTKTPVFIAGCRIQEV